MAMQVVPTDSNKVQTYYVAENPGLNKPLGSVAYTYGGCYCDYVCNLVLRAVADAPGTWLVLLDNGEWCNIICTY